MCASDDKSDLKLRELLLSLSDALTDDDRRRLHFAIGDEVPRRIRQYSDVDGTLKVFEHLIDNGKIFNCLGDALAACGKLEWSEKFKGKFRNNCNNDIMFAVILDFRQPCVMAMTHPLKETQRNPTLSQSVLADLLEDEEEDSGCYRTDRSVYLPSIVLYFSIFTIYSLFTTGS